ncbi:hypothetical protein I317_07872 [Kwoniella heveanensis CBS 569]|nr:hypothetical protein I317_07872 [Kwoniella heveanensis CBS 569]
MFIQLSNYLTYSQEDRKFNKIIVGITTTCSAGVTIFITSCMFELFVYNFGRYTPFATTKLLAYMCLFDIATSTATQLFFAHRAYKLSRHSKILVGIIGVLVLVSICGAVGFVPLYIQSNAASEVSVRKTRIFIYLWLAAGLGADILITSVIMASLLRSRTGWKSTDKTIMKLLAIIVETQLPPTIIILVFLITFGGFAHENYLDVWPQWVQSKFYTCGLLASLNSRYSLRRAMKNDSSHGKAKTNQAVVHVLTETYIQRSEAGAGSNPSGKTQDAKKPYFSNPAANPAGPESTYSPRRITRKDPLDMDDDSFELSDDAQDVVGHQTHELQRSETDGDGVEEGEVHKMDYLDNPSKTGLTENSAVEGQRSRR